MTRAGSQLLSYAVDVDGSIVSFELRHNRFHHQDDSYLLPEYSLIGQKLAFYISGDETQYFVDELLNSVRTQFQIRTIPYRCDSPSWKRFLTMAFTPREDGTVEISHHLIREEQLPSEIHFLTSPISDCVRCSICCRIGHQGSWYEPEQALEKKLLSPRLRNPIIYLVCDECTSTSMDS